jgi:hypothetical protein
MRAAAAVALGTEEQTQQQLQQQGAEGVSLQQHPVHSVAGSVLEQMLVLLLQHQGLVPLTAAAAGADEADSLAGSKAGSSGGCTLSPLQACFSSSSSSREGLFVPVLVWEQHLLWLQLAGLLGQQSFSGVQCSVVDDGRNSNISSTGGGDRGLVCGLSLLQMLLLVQGQGPCLLSLLLLDTVTLMLNQQQQQGVVTNQPWGAMLTVLQNAVTGAAIAGSCNWQYTAAAVRCLAALYAAAEATYSSSNAAAASSSNGSNAAAAVVGSPWNAAVVQAAVERLSQKAAELKAVATAAMAAEAGSDGAFKLSYR